MKAVAGRRANLRCHSSVRPPWARTGYQSLITNHPRLRRPSNGLPETRRVLGKLIDTPERLETRVSRRKQSIGYTPNRYSFYLTISLFPGCSASSLQFPASSFQNLPETAFRVETHVSHRKQTTAYRSTRDGSRLPKLRLSLQQPDPRNASCQRGIASHVSLNFLIVTQALQIQTDSVPRHGTRSANSGEGCEWIANPNNRCENA
jgi:hypothetical protein